MINKEYSSFRDPAGFIYYENDLVYRKISKEYIDTFKKFNDSELCKKLFNEKKIVKHKIFKENTDEIILEVEKIPFISYPYEWCFEELKDAALLTLEIEKLALQNNFTLKDASAYNIQFIGSNPIFIDTLSFKEYKENETWEAYGQFCKHFLAPLVIMSKVNENLNCLLKSYIDGIPLDIASDILKSRGGLIAFEHIKLHSKFINKNNKKTTKSNAKISKQSVINIVDMLIRQISSLKIKSKKTEWDSYYTNTNYTDDAFSEKINIVKEYLKEIKITNNDIICDTGANDGTFSKLALEYGAYVLALDIDYNCVKRNYINSKANNENMLPLLYDLNNPTPAIGFNLKERKSINDRINVKCILALALIHHICISNNVPFDKYFESINGHSKYLIIEFVPKDDSKVMELLSTRNDIFNEYDEKHFEESAKKFFNIKEKKSINGSKRILYLMESKHEN